MARPYDHPGAGRFERDERPSASGRNGSTIVSPLFVAGCPRSGTTALTDYLNRHEEILMCRERYKRARHKIDPAALTFKEILNYEPRRRGGETNTPREHHEELLARKDPAKLAWIGDKHPGYVVSMKTLAENNPGAHFIIIYRPLEEVAESYEARSRNPDDPWLGGKDGFALAIADWNEAMRSTRDFVENDPACNVLVIDYHSFFYENEECIPRISRFLELDFDERVRDAWARMSAGFEAGRRPKRSLTEEQILLIEKEKDHLAEGWVLDCIERQRSAPDLFKGSRRKDVRRELADGFVERRRQAREQSAEAVLLERRIRKLRRDLDSTQSGRELLQQRNERLADRLESMRASRSWRWLSRIKAVKDRLSGGLRGGG